MNHRWMRTLLAACAFLPATAALAIGEPPKVMTKPAPEPVDTTPLGPVTVEALPAGGQKRTQFRGDLFSDGHNLDQLARWDIAVCVSVKACR